MKNIIFLLVVLFIAFVSCDGRERVQKTNTEILKEHKLLDSFSEEIKYFPKKYSETETDTILNNGYHIRIKSYVDMENSYLNKFRIDSMIYKHYYRDSKSTVLITKDGIIFDKIIDKKLFLSFDNSLTYFFNESILHSVWIDEEKSLLNSNVTIDILFCKPETDWCEFFNLIIEDNGKYKIINVTEEKEKDL